jgi:acyl carrier protein
MSKGKCKVMCDLPGDEANAPELADYRRRLVSIWKNAIGDVDVTPGSDFFELGGDSLGMLTVLFQVGEEFGIEVAPDIMFENPTVQQFAGYLVSVANGRPDGPIGSTL